MKIFTTVLVFSTLFSMIACSKIYGPVKELDAYIAVKDAILADWAKNIDANPNQQGVAACRKTFEAKKSELLTAKKAFDDAPRGINPDSVNHKEWASDDMDDKVLDAIMAKLVSSTAETSADYRTLRNDFEKAAGRHK